MSNILLSKIILFYRIKSSQIYLFIRNRFKSYFDKRELNFLFKNCSEIKPVIEEMNFFYDKVSTFKVSYLYKKEKNLLDNKNLTYGEITWKTAIRILDEFNIKDNDILCDLGCGSAKIVFLANIKYGIKTIGIDIIESFIKISKIIKKKLKLKNIDFKNTDFFNEDLKKYNLFFITATCFDNNNFNKLIDKLENLPKGTKIAIVTRIINNKNFYLYKIIRGSFSWGLDYVYFYKLI